MMLTKEEDIKLLKYIMLITFAFGLLAHAYQYFNPNFSHDALWRIYTPGHFSLFFSVGRLLTPFYNYIIGKNVAIPWIIGILSIAYTGFTAYYIIKTLEIRKKIVIGAICAILITEHSLAALNASFFYTADVYRFSALLAVLAVYLFEKFRYSYILSAGLILCSLSFYQANLALSVGLVLIVIVKKVLESFSWQQILSYVKKALFAGSAGLLMYLIILYLVKEKAGIVLHAHAGINDIGNFSDISIISLIANTYKNYFGFYVKEQWYLPIRIKLLHLLLSVASILALVYLISKRKENNWNVLLAALAVIFMPFAFNLTYFTSKGSVSQAHTQYAYVCLYIFWGMLFEKIWDCWNGADKRKFAFTRNLSGGCLIISLLLIISNNLVFSNSIYMRRQLSYDATYSAMTRVVYAMESTEGFAVGQPMVIIADEGGEDGFNSYLDPFRTGGNGFSKFSEIRGFQKNTSLTYFDTYVLFLNTILGVPVNLVDESERQNIVEKEEVKEMPVFPSPGYCKVVDGVMVVKLQE